MPGLYRDEGIVLRTIKLGEADRIVTIMTRGHGKVRAVAKGVRKTKSRFGARLEPVSRISLQCYQGRELDVVTQVETINATVDFLLKRERKTRAEASGDGYDSEVPAEGDQADDQKVVGMKRLASTVSWWREAPQT